MDNIEKARFNMVEQQIHPWEITDSKVIDALFKVKREQFVPEAFLNMAFMDIKVPLNIANETTGEYMLEPKIEARLAQELQLNNHDAVLEIGTGSGYQAALLAQLCANVVSVEINPVLANFAKQNLKKAGVENVTVETGDASKGWSTACFSAILITGAVPEVLDSLKYQLTEGGRLVAIVGTAPAQSVVRITRLGAAQFSEESLFETQVPPLKGIETSSFKF